jgi:putative redox protein
MPGLTTLSVESSQIEGLRSEVRARNFTLVLDEPEALGGSDSGPTPAELVLASLAACQQMTYRLQAERLGIRIEGLEVKVSGEIDLAGYLEGARDAKPGFRSIRVEVAVESPQDDVALMRLKEEVDRLCPVLSVIRGATEVTLAWRRSPPQEAVA